DPEIERLERLLGRFAPVPAMPPLPAPVVRWGSPRTFAPMLATAAAVILMVARVWRAAPQSSPTWTVAAVAGQPRIGTTAFESEGRLAVGDTLVTDPASRARINVGTIGEVTI